MFHKNIRRTSPQDLGYVCLLEPLHFLTKRLELEVHLFVGFHLVVTDDRFTVRRETATTGELLSWKAWLALPVSFVVVFTKENHYNYGRNLLHFHCQKVFFHIVNALHLHQRKCLPNHKPMLFKGGDWQYWAHGNMALKGRTNFCNLFLYIDMQ